MGNRRNMTPSQKKAIEYLRREILKSDSYGSDDYEYKKFEVETINGVVFIHSVVGQIGDEGSYAEIFARTTRHIAIGRRGGADLLNAKHKSKSKGLWNAANSITKY